MTPVTLKTRLPDNDGNGIAAVSAAGAKKYGAAANVVSGKLTKGEWHGPQPGQPDFTYWPKGYTPPVEEPTPGPTPEPTPVPVSSWTISNGEAFALNDKIAAGLNRAGTLGTRINPGPAGYPYRAGYTRLGLSHVATKTDVILAGAVGSGFVVGWGSGSIENMPGMGPMLPLADWTANGRWTSSSGPLRIARTARLDGAAVVIDTVVTNIGSTALPQLRWSEQVDFDDADEFAVKATIAARNRIDCALKGGLVASLYTADPRARASFVTLTKSYNADPFAPELYEKAPEPGFTKAGDLFANLTYDLGPLAAGASVSFSTSYSVA